MINLKSKITFHTYDGELTIEKRTERSRTHSVPSSNDKMEKIPKSLPI
jgi:hypothetical protein